MRASFNFGYVEPNNTSEPTQSISTGRYSLSARSNVPFVQLQGAGGFVKAFTWGEIVEVPDGEICVIKNVSFHGGDIVLNAGCDYDNRPARITVPVSLVDFDVGGTDYVTGVFPADVRCARRAYCTVQGSVSPLVVAADCFVVGKRFDGSHNTDSTITIGILTQEPGSGYQNNFDIPGGIDFGLLPLGQNAIDGDDSRPMALLTTANIYLGPVADLQFPEGRRNAYYILEY